MDDDKAWRILHSKPPLDDVLIHYGVKGQRWGVRDSESQTARSNEYRRLNKKTQSQKPPSKQQAEKNYQQRSKVFVDKVRGHDYSLTPEQKATGKKVAIGTAVVGGILGGAAIYGAYKVSPKALKAGESGVTSILSKRGDLKLPKPSTTKAKALLERGASKFSKPDTAKAKALFENSTGKLKNVSVDSQNKVKSFLKKEKALTDAVGPGVFKPRLPGEKLTPEAYRDLAGKSWRVTPTLRDAAFARDGFELPAGHTFYRVSSNAESHWGMGSDLAKDYGHGTYATGNVADFNRYVAVYRGQRGLEEAGSLHQVSFKSLGPIKVPSVTQILDTLRDTHLADTGQRLSKEETVSAYKRMHGKAFSSNEQISLLNALKKKGFGAIVDEFDEGNIAERPMIVFGGFDKFTGKTSTKLGAAGVLSAENNLTEITNRENTLIAAYQATLKTSRR